ncbi:TonB-dependent receptor [Tamlana sp. 1_MG-2023]|uniref:SusC/RagA family TonB-linked outer membrane protein n=1 Tax=Tamlana sp. 1_MG-2023 TaxID=3062628 RepID=UPI0026E3DE00|nr:TonB-dependent receptor [Tamlana sp. 1_MG-2023]MDO6792069.1 TonB-dependent receptor [Tamlana sp. 1_MG-2023]
MKKFLTVIVFMVSVSVFAQNKTVSGVIKDSGGIPLPGANILEKGTTNGALTDFDGEFNISNLSENSILEISYVGFAKLEVPVQGKTRLNIVLEEDAAALEAVVVIGYGTVKKKDLTGAVSTVDTDKAYLAPVASLDNGLQGRASGVQVTTASGAPGASASIRIRGGNSITAGNDPLYVIDGFVGVGDLSSINPNDIESIQILKDASSTAIYGARGTNGVVLVTTKKGRKGKLSLNFRTSTGFQELPGKIDVQTGEEFATFINNADSDPSDGLPFDLNNLPGEETDWQDVMIQSAQITDHQLSVSGGSENTQFYFSGGYLKQDGIVKGSGFKRYSLRTNIDSQISDSFKIGLNTSLSRTETDNNNINFVSLIRADPRKPVYDANGNYTLDNAGFLTSNPATHPLAQNTLNQNETTRNRALLNTYFEVKMLKNFTWKSTFGGDFTFSKTDEFIPSSYPTSIVNNRLGQADINRFDDMNLLNENTLSYINTFGDHSVNVLGGITWQNQNRQTVIVEANEIPSDAVGVNEISLAPVEETSVNSNYAEYSFFSLLARAQYSFKDKYLLTGTIRRDGSSRLGENNKYGVFPSVALAWNISDEPFIENVDAIESLKIRTSVGQTGNSEISPFSTLATFNVPNAGIILNGTPTTQVEQGSQANPDLKWETTTQYDVGLEFSLFNHVLSGEVDLYYKKTEDLLLDASVPQFTGYTTTIRNVGSVQNKGIDVTLNSTIINTEDFGWNVSLSVSANRNEVLDLGDNTFIQTQTLLGTTSSRLQVGEPVGIFWGSVYEGIDPLTGDAIFADVGGPNGVPDGVYDDEHDQVKIGDPNPDFYGGFQTSFRYKNFDLEAFFPFSVGNENYNLEARLAGETQLNSFSQLRDNIWSRVNTENATYPRVGSSSFDRSNSYFVQDASFFRLGTLQLGYTLPSDLLKGVSNFRVYCTGTNLFIIKNNDYLGFDPDVNGLQGTTNANRDISPGFDNVSYPQSRSILLGFDITF